VAERVVVNTELSMFGKAVLPTTRWDDLLNSNHRLPDYQPLEYLITGRYLGEIARLIIMDAISTVGLFNGEVPERLNVPYAFETRTLAFFESDRTPDLSEASEAFITAHPMRSRPQPQELQFIRDVATLASTRATAFLATALHALWAVRTAAEGIAPDEASHVTIACDGSTVEKYPNFRTRAQHYLDELCILSGASSGAVTLDLTPEGSIFGAAVAVSCMDDEG
jgi:hexokinase